MNIMHVEARYKEIFELPQKFIDSLPKKLILFTTIQYMNSLKNVEKQLKNNGIEVELLQMRHCAYEGQILGCSNTKISSNRDVLFIGDGAFHPKAILLKNDIKVHTFNPQTKENKIFTKKDVEKMLKKIKGSYVKFLSSKKIGVLITTKFGQNKEKLIENLERDFPDKKFYYLLADTYNFDSLEDFPFIEMYLNTMCERIGYDDSDVQKKSILNVEDLYEFQSEK